MNDIYIRKPNKRNYSIRNIEECDMLELFIQEIEMVLTTIPTSVLGSENFGVGLKEFIWETNQSNTEIKSRIENQITKFCTFASMFDWNVDINFFKDGNDIAAIVDIIIEDNNIVQIVCEK